MRFIANNRLIFRLAGAVEEQSSSNSLDRFSWGLGVHSAEETAQVCSESEDYNSK